MVQTSEVLEAKELNDKTKVVRELIAFPSVANCSKRRRRSPGCSPPKKISIFHFAREDKKGYFRA